MSLPFGTAAPHNGGVGRAAKKQWGGDGRLFLFLVCAVLGVVGLWWGLGGGSGRGQAAGGRSARPTEIAAPLNRHAAQPTRGATWGGEGSDSAGPPGSVELVSVPEGAGASSSARDAAGPAGQSGRQSFPNGIWVEGFVVDGDSAAPLAETLVRLEVGAKPDVGAALRSEAVSDSEGRFRLRWSADVPADLFLSRTGYLDARRPNVPLGEFLELRLDRAARIHGSVRGAVAALARSEDDERPMALAWYASTSSERLWEPLETELGEDGAFVFEPLVPGDYVLTAIIPERVVPFVAGVHVEAGETREVILEALPAARVEGRVVERSGIKGASNRGVPNAKLRLEPLLPGLPRAALDLRSSETSSDEGGYFSFEGLAPGSHRLHVSLPWSLRLTRPVDVPASGETATVEVLCRASARLGGTLVDSEGRPVDFARVAIFIEKDPLRRAQMTGWTFDEEVPVVWTSAAGEFLFEACPAKTPITLAVRRTYRVSNQVDVSSSIALSVEPLQPGEARLDARFELPDTAQLTGRVLDSMGTPVGGAKVELYRRKGKLGTRLAMTTTYADGEFVLAGVPTGKATLFVSAPEFLSVTEEIAIPIEGAEVEVILGEALVVEGVALDREGIAIAGLPVRLKLVPESEVSPEHARRKRKHVSVTDDFGRFRFERLFDAQWEVSGGSFEWELVGADPEILVPPLNAWTTLTFDPRERAERFTIVGRVEGADGLPPPGLRIEGLRGGLLEVDRGNFVASGLTPTTHRLVFIGDGHRRSSVGPIAPNPGGEVNIGLVTLELASRVTVRVSDRKGNPVPEPSVFLTPLPLAKGGPSDRRQVDLARQGKDRFRTTQAARAVYRLVVKADGFETHREVLDLRQRASVGMRVLLQRSSR